MDRQRQREWDVGVDEDLKKMERFYQRRREEQWNKMVRDSRRHRQDMKEMEVWF